jgi:hypothetical protein
MKVIGVVNLLQTQALLSLMFAGNTISAAAVPHEASRHRWPRGRAARQPRQCTAGVQHWPVVVAHLPDFARVANPILTLSKLWSRQPARCSRFS